MKIISVVGARPNFMKIAPFIHAYTEAGDGETIDHILVHTGQHYDGRMSRSFFQDLNIPDADINIGIGSGSHAEQVGHTMIAFEKVLQDERPDGVVAVGDVNATCACSITAKKEHANLAHIEAGLRSWDMTTPEEINRLVTLREHGGASVLVGNNVENIRIAYQDTLALDRRSIRPELWDEHTAERIVNEMLK